MKLADEHEGHRWHLAAGGQEFQGRRLQADKDEGTSGAGGSWIGIHGSRAHGSAANGNKKNSPKKFIFTLVPIDLNNLKCYQTINFYAIVIIKTNILYIM